MTAMSFGDTQKMNPRDDLKKKYEMQVEMKNMQVETIDPDQIVLKRKPNDFNLDMKSDFENKSKKR